MTEIKNKNQKPSNIPNLRFPEFFQNWEVKKLGEICKKKTSKNKNNEIDIVFSNSATKGIILQNDYFDKDIANANNLGSYYIVKPFDFVYNPRISSSAKVGAMNINYTNQTGLVSPLYTVFRIIDENVNNDFLIYFFKSDFWHSYMKSIANYGVRDDRMNIKDNDFFELPVSFPTLAEQQKIATFLSKIDERISVQRALIKDWGNFIFWISRDFFSDEKKMFRTQLLKSVCTIKKGQQINVSELTNTGKYYVMNGGITPSGYYSEYNVKENIISISEGGNSCGYVQFNDTKFWSGGHCYTLQNINNKIFNKYLFYYLKNFEKKIMALRVGSGLPNIQKNTLENFEIKICDEKNQKLIVRILDCLYQKLHLETQLLEQYQMQKKYLLQQMFI